jgi:SAM-dependent methyltransferase
MSIAEINNGVWGRGRFVGQYSSRALRPVEVTLLVRYRDELHGRMLEIGCGAGRVTSYLADLADDLHALDISPRMVETARRRVPSASLHVADMTDLSRFDDEPFDAVLALYAVLDVLDDSERNDQLERMHAAIAPGGLLVISTHNRAHLPQVRGPHVRTTDPVKLAADVVRLPRRFRNHRRVKELEREAQGYAIANDSAHNYSLLHYYISRDDQEQQLSEHGFELIECLDLDGHPVRPGESAEETSELHYVARRT